uniref:Uncharacterized protein n=1 Tax=Quercus lobata TaxID=97700 RepID=A0A7N2LZ40_QUELO
MVYVFKDAMSQADQGSDGALGGVLIMWDCRVVEKVEEVVGQYSVSCRFKNVGDQLEWALTSFYGPNLNKRLGAENFTQAMHNFSDFISSHGPLDAPLEGGLYTWSTSSSVSRLDRFLFLNTGMFSSLTYLKAAKKQILWNELNALDVRAERYLLSGEEKSEIEKTTLSVEISWRKKSRLLNLREGDSNTKFFRHMANSNCRNKSITSITVDGTLTSNQDSIIECITHFYRSLFTRFYRSLYSDQQVSRSFPDVLVFPRLSREKAVCKLGYAKVSCGAPCLLARQFGHHRNGHIWIAVPHCLMWCLLEGKKPMDRIYHIIRKKGGAANSMTLGELAEDLKDFGGMWSNLAESKGNNMAES